MEKMSFWFSFKGRKAVQWKVGITLLKGRGNSTNKLSIKEKSEETDEQESII